MVSDTQSNEKILFILPYIKGTTDRIDRILNKQYSNFKSPKKIGQILKNPKDLPSASECTKYFVPRRNTLENWENDQPMDEHQRQVKIRNQHTTSKHDCLTKRP